VKSDIYLLIQDRKLVGGIKNVDEKFENIRDCVDAAFKNCPNVFALYRVFFQ